MGRFASVSGAVRRDWQREKGKSWNKNPHRPVKRKGLKAARVVV